MDSIDSKSIGPSKSPVHSELSKQVSSTSDAYSTYHDPDSSRAFFPPTNLTREYRLQGYSQLDNLYWDPSDFGPQCDFMEFSQPQIDNNNKALHENHSGPWDQSFRTIAPSPIFSAPAMNGEFSQGIDVGTLHADTASGPLHCQWKNCNSTTTFSSGAALVRHVRSFHMDPGSYVCGVEGCTRMFGRLDKIKEHMKKSHHSSQIHEYSFRAPNVIFKSKWELPLIVQDTSEKGNLLLNMLTLTKSENTVKATTCRQYIEKLYGPKGILLLHKIIRALERDDGTFVGDGMIIKADSYELHVELPQSVSDFWNLLMWLCLTFRQPKPGQVSLSTGHVDGMDFTIQELSLAMIPEETDCWSPLFKAAIIAVDPRTKSGPETFLEADFDLMLQLTAVEYPVMAGDGLILMGYSTALVPVKEIDQQTILWHLETASHDFQLKVDEISAIKGNWLKRKTFADLQSKRVLLGWCPEAITLLGTRSSGSTVRWSDAKLKQYSWNWKGATASFTAATSAPLQIGAQAGLAFERSTNTLQFSAAGNYEKRLTTSMTEQVVLYDVNDSRAWLVPLICVFHEMLLAFHQKIPPGHRKDDPPLAKPASNGALASFDALSENGEYIVGGSGQNLLRVRDLILGFSVNLSKTSLREPSRSKIYGYEFMDIVMDSTQSELKRSHIKKEGLAWTSLLSRVNCLFCSDLGDAIIGLKANAQTSVCNQLPKGFDWLATSMHSINALNDRYGSQCSDMGWKISSQHYWSLAGTPFKACQHTDGSDISCWNSCSFLQEITGQTRKPPQNGEAKQYSSNGAVVFGRSSRTMCRVSVADPFLGVTDPNQLTQHSTAVAAVRTSQ